MNDIEGLPSTYMLVLAIIMNAIPVGETPATNSSVLHSIVLSVNIK